MLKTYETRDFYLGCLLLTNGFNLSSSEKKNDGVYFKLLVDDEAKLGKLLLDFSNSQAMVNLRAMKSAMATLRHELDKYKNRY